MLHPNADNGYPRVAVARSGADRRTLWSMDAPTAMHLQQLDDTPDAFAFRFAFNIEGKSLEDGGTAQTVTVEDNGDLIIEGYAAIFEGDDRQGENFAPGAFERGIKSFLAAQSALCFHHKHDHVLGKVLDLRQEEGKGLKMRARVDGAIKDHPVLKTYYGQIKSGTLNGLSIGGYFKRGMIDGKQKIIDTDFTEISVTGVPVHSGPSFAVLAGKALSSDIELPKVPDLGKQEIRQADVDALSYLIEEMNSVFTRIGDSVDKRKVDEEEPAK